MKKNENKERRKKNKNKEKNENKKRIKKNAIKRRKKIINKKNRGISRELSEFY